MKERFSAVKAMNLLVLTLYGKKLCRKLCAFIVENAINDLHTSNIGYNHNKPIILDFSGYDRGY